MKKPIRVLVVDDSALVRKMLTKMLDQDPGIEVVATAADAFAARSKIKKYKPDVLTLDIEMPKMDGVTFLRNLMRLHPMPVVMVSSLTEKGADITLEALEVGAVDFVSKPKADLANTLEDYSEEIIGKVRAAAGARVGARTGGKSTSTLESTEKFSADAILSKRVNKNIRTTQHILAIGASTGGTEAIKEVLLALPATAPATVITQHIPASFSGPFSERMNRVSAMQVCEATDGQEILQGHAYIAPGGHHLLIVRVGDRYHCKLSDGPPVNRHKPSVDVLFRSVAQQAGHNAMGVILTGMGDDGARGMRELQETGAPTIAQDEASCVVWGMPGAAVKLGAADQVMPLRRIAGVIMSWAELDKKYGT